MDCQICLRQLEPLEPVYRMQLGPAINNGRRTSICEKCFYALIESLKRPGLKNAFRSKEPCEECGRLVFNPKGWKVTRVICSPGCLGELGAEQAKQFRVPSIS